MTRNTPAVAPERLAELIAKNAELVFRLFHENSLIPKKKEYDYAELTWRISNTPLGWPGCNPFGHNTDFHPHYEMRTNFRLDRHLIASCFHPYISITTNHEHNSVSIKGTLRTQTRFYRHKYFNEHDWTFLNYVYAPDMDYDDLLEKARGAFQPEMLRRFISLEVTM